MGGRKTDPIEKLVGQYAAWLGGLWWVDSPFTEPVLAE